MRHRALLALLLPVLALAATAGCSRETSGTETSALRPPVQGPERRSTLESIRARGTVRVGVKYDVPLFGLADPATGRLEGFDIEIALGLAQAIFDDGSDPRSRVEFVEAISRNRERFLQNGTVDIIVSTYTINDARKQLVDFAGPYYIAGQDILARREEIASGSIRGVADVAGRKVCSVTGSTSLVNLRLAAPTADTSVTRDKYSECFADLVVGRVDAISTDDAILLGFAAEDPRFTVTGNPFHTEPYGVGLPKGDDRLRALLDDALEAMMRSGAWAEAFRRTIGATGAIVPRPPAVDRY